MTCCFHHKCIKLKLKYSKIFLTSLHWPSFTSTIRQLPVITESLWTKRSISAVLFPFPLMTKGTAIGLQPSPPTPEK